MNWWRRLAGGSSESETRKPDFLAEALELEARGDYGNALTSYRLALRERPNDLSVLQNIAIALSKTGQTEEAIRTYKRALELDPELAGAHYGLAFLLLKRRETELAAVHLESYLRTTSEGDPKAQRFREHAWQTLAEIMGEEPGTGADHTARHDESDPSSGREY